MTEAHPFKPFVPKKAKYLLLGSFVALRNDNTYDWYYGKKVNQFWPIIESVYKVKLPGKKERQALFKKLKMAVTDIIIKCERKTNNSMDNSLINCVYNLPRIKKILKENNIVEIFFTSKYVEKEFKKRFKELIEKYPQINMVTLPSPSPRYASISIKEKIRRYMKLLPDLQ